MVAIKKFSSKAIEVYRYIYFDSKELLMQALFSYILPKTSKIDVTQLEVGESYSFTPGIPFEEQCLISSSENKKRDDAIKDGGISFDGKWMISFAYTGNISLQGTLVVRFTDRDQLEVLFKIGLKGKVTGIIKENEGSYTLFCQLPSKIKVDKLLHKINEV